jgi:hypothetical protein
MLVVAEESEAAEIARSFGSGGPQGRWPALPLGTVTEEELTYLGIELGVCDDEDQDSVIDEELAGEPPHPFVCRVIPAFIDALARMDAEQARQAARQWRDADGRRCGGSRTAALLAGMANFAREARAADKALLLVFPMCGRPA